MECPICAQSLEGGELVMVCNVCHKSLGGGRLNATGEFRVPTPADVAAMAEEPATEHPGTTHACAWCGKGEPEVKKLLGRGDVALCNECVALCVDILDAELGSGWR